MLKPVVYSKSIPGVSRLCCYVTVTINPTRLLSLLPVCCPFHIHSDSWVRMHAHFFHASPPSNLLARSSRYPEHLAYLGGSDVLCSLSTLSAVLRPHAVSQNVLEVRKTGKLGAANPWIYPMMFTNGMMSVGYGQGRGERSGPNMVDSADCINYHGHVEKHWVYLGLVRVSFSALSSILWSKHPGREWLVEW